MFDTAASFIFIPLITLFSFHAYLLSDLMFENLLKQITEILYLKLQIVTTFKPTYINHICGYLDLGFCEPIT